MCSSNLGQSLGRACECYIVWGWMNIHLLYFNTIVKFIFFIKFGTKFSIEKKCIYCMHFVCCNVYILLTMLIIEIILYVSWVKLVWSALPKVFLLMKLVLSALPYVLMSTHNRFGILEHIIYLRLFAI